MRRNKLLRTLPRCLLPAILVAGAWCGAAHAADWRVSLCISNGAGLRDTIQFGVHPDGTAGVDPLLGEVGLPPWPPSSLFDVRFLVSGSEGVALDLRDTTHTERIHTIKWQAGSGGYPVTVKWDRTSLPYGSLYISDGYGGVFLPPVNMYGMDSLRVPVSMSYITQLTLSVIPGVSPGADPEVGGIPGATVFAGQQFPECHLDEFVFDPDTPDSLIDWFVTGNQALIFHVGEDRVLRIEVPAGWTGSETVTFTARDPEHHADQAAATFTVIQGGLPSWSIPVTIQNGGSENRTVWFGIHPDATDAIDQEFGEVELPPWPPQTAFDARFLLPDDVASSVTDVRRSLAGAIFYHLKWQPGEGGYPVTVSWPGDLPLGTFFIKDDMGGAYISPVDMSSVTEVVIPPELSFITGLSISASAVVDTAPPLGPRFLQYVDHEPGQWVTLAWDPCVESHFAYYEIVYDTVHFDDSASFVWDWTEDASLTNQGTTTATIYVPWPDRDYGFRIRAWDAFGNAGELSNIVFIGITGHDQEQLPPSMLLKAWPNPFQSTVNIGFQMQGNGPARLAIYDVAGRQLVSHEVKHSENGAGILSWDGRDGRGRRVSSGLYFCTLHAGGESLTKKLLLLK